MSTSHVFAGVVGAIGLAVALAYAAPPQLIQIDDGLWEINAHPQASGTNPLPPELLAKLSPAQREKALAAVGKPRIFKTCITPERRQYGVFGAQRDSQKPDKSGCKSTLVINTSTEYEAHVECTTPQGTTTTTEHIKYGGRRQLSGMVDVVQTENGNTTTLHNAVEGKWVSADCGDIK